MPGLRIINYFDDKIFQSSFICPDGAGFEKFSFPLKFNYFYGDSAFQSELK